LFKKNRSFLLKIFSKNSSFLIFFRIFVLKEQLRAFNLLVFISLISFMNLYVSNLPYSISEEELEAVFSELGVVTSTKIITDRETRRSRGFGFVEMESDEDGEAAIEELNGVELKDREIQVKKAMPREDRGGGNFGGGRPSRDY
jgi:RNA recognition motif-containing protein